MIYKAPILLKTYKRYINTKVLREALVDMNISSASNKLENIKDNLFKLETIEVKTETKPDTTVYEDVLQNIRESENYLEIVRENLVLTKKNQLNLEIKVVEVKDLNGKEVINNLNDKTVFFRDEKSLLENVPKDNVDTINFMNKNNEIIVNTNKSIWDISWLQPFFDFMHNHSTLVFTVGGGMLLGGMLFLTNFGYINIGSLVARLGLNLFNTSLPQQVSNPLPPSINITVENPQNNVREISSGFFRELGKKLLVVIDLYIEKLKDNRLKYK